MQVTSVEAEAYDELQSVEASVMNHSDTSSVIEKIYHGDHSSRLSDVSRHSDWTFYLFQIYWTPQKPINQWSDQLLNY